MWTVLIGENGLCKTTILQAIAIAAIGPGSADKLADIASLPDRRRPHATARVVAEFGFGADGYGARRREYPGLGPRPAPIPRLCSIVSAKPGFSLFEGESWYLDSQPGVLDFNGESRERPSGRPLGATVDPIREARGKGLPYWFVAGYGTTRALPLPRSIERYQDPVLERLASLFDRGTIVGTAFADLLGDRLVKHYARALQHALLDQAQVLPRIKNLELRGQGGVRSAKHLVESHRFEFETGQRAVRVPATWLSQGYQAMISWVADLLGQIFWEAQEAVRPDQMEGLVLIDEIDIHLHPTWQLGLITALKKTFPRIQFVATTHSAMVLPGLERDEIVQVRLDEGGNVSTEVLNQSPDLLTGSEILDTFFGIDKLYPAQVGEDLLRYGYLSTNSGRTDEEEAELTAVLARLRDSGVQPSWEPKPRRARR